MRIPLEICNSESSNQIIDVRWHQKREKSKHFDSTTKWSLVKGIWFLYSYLLKTFYAVVTVDCQIKDDFNWTWKNMRRWCKLFICCNCKLGFFEVFFFLYIRFLILKIDFSFLVLTSDVVRQKEPFKLRIKRKKRSSHFTIEETGLESWNIYISKR